MEAFPLPDPVLEDDEIVLCPFSDLDLGPLVRFCNDAQIARFTFLPAPYEPRHARDFVFRQDERRETLEALDLSIRERGDLRLLGSVGMRAFIPERVSCEVGYWIAPPERGRGLAPRAVGLFTAWLLASLPVERVLIPLDEANDASRRVAEKSGFELSDDHRRLHAKGREWHMDVYTRSR